MPVQANTDSNLTHLQQSHYSRAIAAELLRTLIELHRANMVERFYDIITDKAIRRGVL